MIKIIIIWILKLSPVSKRWFWKKWYNIFAQRAKNPKLRLMNYGYSSEGMSLHLEAEDELERYPIQLYNYVSSHVVIKDKIVLEVGSGRGGGASFIARYLKPENITGIDISSEAIALCKNIYNIKNLNFLFGDAEDIPLQDNSYDVVVNVESSHCYGSMKVFLNEVYRVLKPGGSFLFCDFRTKQEINKLYDYFNNSDFIFVNRFDITDNILKGLDNLSDYRKKNIEKSVPFLIRSIFETYAGIKDTDIYNSFKNGEMIYICAILKKQI